MSYDASVVRHTLVKLYDLEELRTLCMDLDVDYDSLRGEGKAAKARELVLYLDRRGRLDALAAAIVATRGADALGDADDATTTPSGPTGRSQTTVNTGGGAYIGGNVTMSGGDFVGRDKRTGTMDDDD